MAEGSSDDAMGSLGGDNVVEDVIDCMVKGKALKNTIPAFVQCGLDLVGPAMDIPASEEDITLEDKATKMAVFYKNVADASNAYTGNDAELRQEYLNAFALIGLYGDEIEIYVAEMVNNRVMLCSIDDVAEYTITNGYGEGRLKRIEPDFVTQDELKIVRSSSQINWETEKHTLSDIFSGFSKISNSLQAEGEDIDNMNFEQVGFVFDKIQESQVLDGVDQNLMIALLDSAFFDAIDVGQTLMLNVRDPEKYETINFTTTFVTLGNTAKIAKEFSEIADPSSERTDLSADEVASMLNGLQDPTTSELMKDLANEENLKKAGATESQSEAIGTVIDVLSTETTEKVPESDAEQQKEAGAVKNLISTVEAVNGRTDATQNIFATQEDANEFIDSMMTSSYVYALTINNGVKLGFLQENNTDPVTYTSLLSASDKAMVENALNNSAYSSAENQQKTQNIARTLFGMNDYVYGGNNY